MPIRGQAGWKSRAKKFAELLGSDDMIKTEKARIEAEQAAAEAAMQEETSV